MTFFLYGPDTYRLQRKLAEIIEKYKKTHKGGLNLRYLDCNNFSFSQIEDELRQNSMFKEKKMFIIKNAFSSNELKKGLIKKGKNLEKAEDIIVFCQEGKVLKKDPLFIFFKKSSKIQEFNFLNGSRLNKWIKDEFSKLTGSADEEAIKELIFSVGNDLWQMANEIRKLFFFKNGEMVTRKDVKLLVKSKIDLNIFKTIEAIALRDRKRALNLLKAHLERGDSPLYLFSMINYQFRNLLIVKDLLAKGISPFSLTDLHPFVVKKSSFLAKKFDLRELKKIYREIFEVDFNLKTGKIGPEAALELLIVNM